MLRSRYVSNHYKKEKRKKKTILIEEEEEKNLNVNGERWDEMDYWSRKFKDFISMLFGSWCSIWELWSVKPLYNILFHHANTRRKENRVRSIFENIKMQHLRPVEREKDSNMLVYRNASGDCFRKRVESFWTINLLNWHINIRNSNRKETNKYILYFRSWNVGFFFLFSVQWKEKEILQWTRYFLQVGIVFKSVSFRVMKNFVWYWWPLDHGILDALATEYKCKDKFNWIILFESHSLNPTAAILQIYFFLTSSVFGSFMNFQTFWRSECTYVHSSEMPYEWREYDDLYPFHSQIQFRSDYDLDRFEYQYAFDFGHSTKI